MGEMNRVSINSRDSLLYTLFAVFELFVVTAGIALWSVDPRRVSGLDDGVGIAFWVSWVGLAVVSWLLRRAAPRVGFLGLMTVLGSLVTCAVLPAVP